MAGTVGNTKDYDLLPAHIVRLFLWDAFKKNGILDATKYPSGQNPIKTLKEVPTFTSQLSSPPPPYLVWNWNRDRVSENYFLSSDQIVFLIYGVNEGEVRRITQFMSDFFVRYDESADDINVFVSNQPQSVKDRLGAITFKYTNLESAGGPIPYTPDNSRLEAMVSIRVTYTRTARDFAQ